MTLRGTAHRHTWVALLAVFCLPACRASSPPGAAVISDQVAQGAYKNIEAKARLAEIGTLYTAVAGMLNLLTIIDASARAAQGVRRP